MESISRRQMCLLLACLPLAAAGPLGRTARADTASDLAAAEDQQAQVQAQIDDIAAQQSELSLELDSTMGAIESKQGEIDQTKADIEATQEQLSGLQDELAACVQDAYKQGRTHEIEVLLNSSSFEELYRNMYYLTKINDSEVDLIEQVVATKQQLADQEAQLEAEMADLQDLKSTQETQLQDMQDRQNEAYGLLTSLNEQVAALTEQYNQELIAAAQAAAAEAAAAQAAAEAAASASTSAGSSDSGSSYSGGGSVTGSGSAAAVLSACYSTPSPGAGLCAAWVTNVMAQAGISVYGNACDMYASWCYSSDRGSLQPGMIIAVSSHSQTSAGQIYGHIGIYVGGGTVMDNIGYIRSIDVDSWISFYGTTVTPRWGWAGGVALS